jgi:hypothetical protein
MANPKRLVADICEAFHLGGPYFVRQEWRRQADSQESEVTAF